MRDAANPCWHVRHALLAILCGLLVPAHAASTAVVAVRAVVLSKSNCKLTTGATATIDFLTIDPSSSLTLTKSAPMSLTCQGSATTATFSITADLGQHQSAGTRRMINAGDGTFMTYDLSVAPASLTIPKGTISPFSVNATLAPADFRLATAGAYSDTVTITLSP